MEFNPLHFTDEEAEAQSHPHLCMQLIAKTKPNSSAHFVPIIIYENIFTFYSYFPDILFTFLSWSLAI